MLIYFTILLTVAFVPYIANCITCKVTGNEWYGGVANIVVMFVEFVMLYEYLWLKMF